MRLLSMTCAAPLAACIACAFSPAAAFAQARNHAVDFAELVKVLLVPVAAKPDPPSWNLGAHPAIRWKSSAPQSAGAALAKDGLPLSRTGAVQITVGGQVTHRRGTRQPGQWNVVLAGSNTFPMEVRLTMDAQAEGGIAPNDALRAAGFKVRALCKPGGISSGTAVYAVEAPGYRPVAMSHEWSSGSAGTWAELRFAYTKPRAAKFRCE